MTTKKTKAELLDEIKELETQVKKLENYKQYEECADELKAVHTAFVNAGFSDEQAFDLLKTMYLTATTQNLTRSLVRHK